MKNLIFALLFLVVVVSVSNAQDNATNIFQTQVAIKKSLNVTGRIVGNGSGITNLQATNIVAFQASVFPTNAIPLGSATVTNIGFVAWRGQLVFVATNRAVGGWMWQTNGPSGAPVWGAFNPATQP